MANWTRDELDKIAKADELQIVTLRGDGTPRKPVTIWVVRHGNDLYVRSGYGDRAAWYRGTQRERDEFAFERGIGTALRRDKADLDHVLLDHVANRGEQRGDVFAFHPCAAARVEHRLHLLDDKGDIAAAAEHGADHAGQRHGPGEMLHVLRVDEDLERAAAAILNDVVQRDVERVLAVGPAYLVGLPGQGLRPRQRLRHVNDPARLVGIGRAPRRRRRRQWQFALARRD